ncbi:MAG: type VI secretion system-associated FHA domain protein [Pseudomonadota bacterium]
MFPVVAEISAQWSTVGAEDVALKARLTVTGEQGQGLGPLGSYEFGAAGGIIGRSAACDWRLPDPTNTLSARHAEIRFTGQGFTVADLSTNGVYVNVTDAPLGRGNSALLVSGDFVYLGPYVISVDIVRVPDQVPPPAAPRAAPSLSAVPRPGAGGFAASSLSDPNPRAPLDPLAALDGEDTLQESDNPFKDLGIGKRDRDRSDLGLRSGAGRSGAQSLGPIPDFSLSPPPPAAPPPFAAPRPQAPAFAAPEPVPPLMPPPVTFQAPPVQSAPFQPAPSPAAPAQPVEAAVIPPDFLDELSALIPRLADAQKPAQPPVPPHVLPQAPPPQVPPLAPVPLAPIPAAALAPSPDDPEAMVTMLRLRGRAKPGAVAAPAPPQAPPPVPAMAAPQNTQQDKPHAPFWGLFGLDPSHLSAEERDRVLGDVAALLTGLVGGLLELQATRRRMKSELNLDSTQVAGDDNPFRTASSTEDALRRLFATGNLVRRAPEAEARAVFREMQIHELAAMDAMQATIARLMQRISPAAITFEMEGEGQNGGVFARRVDKAKLWDRYLVMHERLVDALDVLSPELVGQEFARAYAHHVQTMRGGQG